MGQGAATAIHPKAEEHPQAYQEKRYATGTPRHAKKASSTTQTQRRHVASACAKATYRWTGNCPHAHEQ